MKFANRTTGNAAAKVNISKKARKPNQVVDIELTHHRLGQPDKKDIEIQGSFLEIVRSV